jgi:hypothetical protein
MPFRVSAAFFLALAGAISISCGGITDPSQNQNEPFSGTVAPGSFSVVKFSASKTGEITVKMGTITPAAVPALSLQWLGAGDGSCNGGLFGATVATSNTTAISNQIVSGNYCLVLSEYVAQTVTATYSLTVSHP